MATLAAARMLSPQWGRLQRQRERSFTGSPIP